PTRTTHASPTRRSSDLKLLQRGSKCLHQLGLTLRKAETEVIGSIRRQHMKNAALLLVGVHTGTKVLHNRIDSSGLQREKQHVRRSDEHTSELQSRFDLV